MNALDQQIRIKTVYTRSINLSRDGESPDLVQSYLPTSRALQALTEIADGLGQDAAHRAMALMGPYGSGKSAFALFLAALLSPQENPAHGAAIAVLQGVHPDLAGRFQAAATGGRGYLRVQVNGIPDSLSRQLLLALAATVKQAGFAPTLVDDIHKAAFPGVPMDRLMALVWRVQKRWSEAGGTGLLIELDELGKFLEYESYHPQHREIHLLQLLAEHAQKADRAPLYLVVMLHQAFEYYHHRLGKQLRDEWQKVQGRFNAIAFLEPAEQSLRIVAAAFQHEESLPQAVCTCLDDWSRRLAEAGALPLGLDEPKARRLFERCYPLHPLTLLILPVLCQKVAQNERTLFSYLGSREPYGLRERMGNMGMGDWIEPWQLYDYFILNQSNGFSDPLTYHRWVEVVTALERFSGAPDDPAQRLLKTIGLLNLIGGQRGLKASQPLLQGLFGDETNALLARLESASIIHFRHYSQEYRVWQGSDFDLRGALREAVAEQGGLSLVDTLNQLAPVKPVVARRATIETGTLRYFVPGFINRDRWPPKAEPGDDLRLWFYLAELDELPCMEEAPSDSVVAVCHITERLRESVMEWLALQNLPRRYAALHHDPVAQREHRIWLATAETENAHLIRTLLDEPESLRWYWGGQKEVVGHRRDLQRKLSDWVQGQCYPKAPKIQNELINWDRPSASANTGRKRLLAAMLDGTGQENLGIEKTPAEMSIYLSVLKQSGLHRKEGGQFGFHPPPKKDPCQLRPLWNAIARCLGSNGERQIPLPELYRLLQQPPYGVKLGVLPVLLTAYLLAHRREVSNSHYY